MAPALLSKDKKQRPKVSSHFKLAEVTLEALNDPLPKAMTIPSLESLPSEGEGQFRPFRNPVEEDPSAAAATISNYPSFKSGLMQKQTIYYPHVTNGTQFWILIHIPNTFAILHLKYNLQKLAVYCLKLPTFENSMNIDQVSFFFIVHACIKKKCLCSFLHSSQRIGS